MNDHAKKYFLDIGTFGGSRVFHRLVEYLSQEEHQARTRKVAKHLNEFNRYMTEISQSNIEKGLKIHIINMLAQEKLEYIKKGFKDQFLNTHLQNAVIARKRDTLRKLK